MSEETEFEGKLREAAAQQGDLREALGAMTLLFGNTEFLIGMAVTCLLRIATREVNTADRLGPLILSQLDMQRKMNLVKMLSEELCAEDTARRIADWRKEMDSAVTRRNQLVHSAWMYPINAEILGNIRLGRSGTMSSDMAISPGRIKCLCSEVGRLNDQLIQCLADLGSLPRVRD